MNDEIKSQKQLLIETNNLRKQILKLEKKIHSLTTENKKEFKNRLPRVELNTEIEAIGDFDILKAKGIEISEGGISFEMKEDLPFELQFYLKDKFFNQRVNLVWLEKKQEGGYRCGFRFIKNNTLTEI